MLFSMSVSSCTDPHPFTGQLWSAFFGIWKGTIYHGLQLRKDPSFSLHAFFYADWASSPYGRRSSSGFALYLGSNLIYWSSKKQCTVARSSIESKYKSLANATTELIWIQSLLNELGVYTHYRPILLCDNLSAIYLTENPIFHARTKHTEIDYYFVCERVSRSYLVVRFIRTNDQTVNILPNGLSTLRFHILQSKLNVRDLPLCLRGSNGWYHAILESIKEILCKHIWYTVSSSINTYTPPPVWCCRNSPNLLYLQLF